MGPALQAAFLVMNHIGGKLLLFQVGGGRQQGQGTLARHVPARGVCKEAQRHASWAFWACR